MKGGKRNKREKKTKPSKKDMPDNKGEMTPDMMKKMKKSGKVWV